MRNRRMVPLFPSPSHSNRTVFAFESADGCRHSEAYLESETAWSVHVAARHSVLWLACAIAAAGGIATRLHLHAAAPDLAGGTFELVARHSGKCLDVSGASVDASRQRSSGTATAARTSSGRSSPPATATTRSSRGTAARRSTSAARRSTMPRRSSSTRRTGANQQWRLEPVGDGYYRLIARHSGKALDVSGVSTRGRRSRHPVRAATAAPTSSGCSAPRLRDRRRPRHRRHRALPRAGDLRARPPSSSRTCRRSASRIPRTSSSTRRSRATRRCRSIRRRATRRRARTARRASATTTRCIRCRTGSS